MHWEWFVADGHRLATRAGGIKASAGRASKTGPVTETQFETIVRGKTTFMNISTTAWIIHN
jgi:hypothetical protein